MKERFLLLRDDEMIRQKHIDMYFMLPLEPLRRCCNVVGSCNGLVCLRSNFGESAKCVVIWNPSIRRSVYHTLSYHEPKKPYFSLAVIGFGFVLGKSEYKLVKITFGKSYWNQHCSKWFRAPMKVQVYEQRGINWKAVDCAPPHYCEGITSSQVFLHGAVHWLALDRAEIHNEIVVFDMGDELFRKITLPTILAKHGSKCLSVELFKGSLAVFYVGESGSGECSLWVMSNYGVSESWTNLYNNISKLCFKTAGFRKNGQILFWTERDAVVSYDLETKTITNTGIQGNLIFIDAEAACGLVRDN